MKYSNGKLLSVAAAFLVLLWIGCQGATLNIPDVGTSENPLEKTGGVVQERSLGRQKS